MEVKPGYKLTEAGVIPEDWEVKAFDDVFIFSGGYTASRDQLSHEGYCYLHYGDIHGAKKTFIDTETDYQDIPKLDVPLKKISTKSLLENGDVVFVDASEDDEGTSRHVVIVNKGEIPFISGLHTIVAKSKNDDLDNEYKRYCFQTEVIQRQFFFYAVGTKVTGISKSNIPKLLLPLPPLSEQRAIAEVLSDVDALLSALDRLIAKKRDLKQAAMQELLTGKTRLPGFSGEWEVLPAKAIGIFKGGNGFPLRNQGNKGKDYPFFKVSDMNNEGNGTIMATANHYVSEQIRKEIGALVFPADSIVFAKVGAAVFLERKRILGQPSCIDNNMAAYILDKSRADVNFIHSIFLSTKLSALVATTALPALNTKQLGEILFSMPPIHEQSAIAAVLSDMDAEIAALEARRDKTRALKDGMMQELLTGRTRLVKPEVNNG